MLGDPYCTVGQLKAHAQITDATDDADLARVVAAISRSIERYCHRQFNDAVTPSARRYSPSAAGWVNTADFHTTTGLVVKTDADDDGTFETTVAATGFELYPLDGVVDGQPGHPFRRIDRLGGATWPTGVRPSVEVTAQWGWAEVPAEVTQAALIKGAKVFRRKYAPDGLVGAGEFVFRITRQSDPDIADLLEPYVRPSMQFC